MTVRKWLNSHQCILRPDTIYNTIGKHWPHVKITHTRCEDLFYAPPPALLEQVDEIMACCADQLECGPEDVVVVLPSMFGGDFIVAFTHDNHAFQFKLMVEPDPYVRVDYYGR
jgi:hypothetical protein